MDANAFNQRLRQCDLPDQCRLLFREAIEPLGLHTFAVGELDLAVRERAVIYVQDWPDDWRNFYIGTTFIERDPVVDALTNELQPYTWSQLRANRAFDLSDQGQSIANAHGWSEGLAIPLGRGLNRIGAVCMAGRIGRLDQPAIDYLSLIGTCLHSHLRSLISQHGVDYCLAGLTQREVDCLQLVAIGQTDAEIAMALGIAVSTAHEYVEKAKRKLCAKSRAEAASIAVSLGIVDL